MAIFVSSFAVPQFHIPKHGVSQNFILYIGHLGHSSSICNEVTYVLLTIPTYQEHKLIVLTVIELKEGTCYT